MRVHKTDSRSHEGVMFNEVEDFFLTQDGSPGQGFEQIEYFPSIFQIAAGKLSHNEIVTHHLRVVEQFLKPAVPSPQMGHPHRGVNDHHGLSSSSARNRTKGFFCSPELAQTPAAFLGNQGFQSLLHKRSLFLNAA